MANTSPHAKGEAGWEKKGAFGIFKRFLLFLTLLESGYGKYACFKGKYCYLRALMGVPRVPDGQYMSPCHEWGGLRKEKVHLTVSREYYWSLPSWKAAKENRPVWGVNIVVWGLWWESPGSQMAVTWPHAMGEVSWEKKRCSWQFWESISGPYPLGKWLKKMGSFWGYVLLFWGLDGGPQGPHIVDNMWPNNLV